MKKMPTMLALAAGALLAGSAAQAPSEATNQGTKAAESLTAGNKAEPGKPTPAKPTSSPAQQQRVYVKSRPVFPEYHRPVYHSHNGPRRVRYGKSRWIVLS